MRGDRALLVVVAVAAIAGAPAFVRAQPAGDAEQGDAEQDVSEADHEARGLFLAGSAAFDRGRYAEALDYFERAYELSDRPGLLYNIGHTAQRLRRDELALESFERYLELAPDADNRAAVEARIELLSEQLASRQQAEDEADDTEGGADGGGPKGGTGDAAPAPDGGPGPGPWIVAGAGAAAAVTGIVLVGLAASSANTVEDAEEGTPWPQVQDDYDRAGSLSIAGGVLLGVGVAAAAAGVTWMLLGGGSEQGPATEPRAGVGVAPGGVVVRGRF